MFNVLYLVHPHARLMSLVSFCSCGELLAMREDDAPDLFDRHPRIGPSQPDGVVQAHQRRIRRWEILYAVQDASLRYQQLCERKESRTKVLQAAANSVSNPADIEAIYACIARLEAAGEAHRQLLRLLLCRLFLSFKGNNKCLSTLF